MALSKVLGVSTHLVHKGPLGCPQDRVQPLQIAHRQVKNGSQLLSDGEQPATEDSRNWLQYSSGLHWGSPQTGCQRLQTASSMPLRLPAPLDSLDHVARKAELLGWQPGLLFWALILGPCSKPADLQVSQ